MINDTDLKVCRTCGDSKPRTLFHNTGWHKRKDGTKAQLIKPDCKVCANKAIVQKYRDNLKLLGIELKCIKCGYDKCEAALDFHHKDPAEKDFLVSGRYTSSLETLCRELEKCVVLCSNCHREYHAGLFELE